MPTQKQVLDAFDSFGDASVQSMALQAKLERQGFDSTSVVHAVNDAIAAGMLVMSATGGIRRVP